MHQARSNRGVWAFEPQNFYQPRPPTSMEPFQLRAGLAQTTDPLRHLLRTKRAQEGQVGSTAEPVSTCSSPPGPMYTSGLWFGGGEGDGGGGSGRGVELSSADMTGSGRIA